MYHHIAPKGKLDDLQPFVVYPDIFARQLDTIIATGFTVASLKAIFDEIETHGSLSGRRAVITFDDCGTNLLEYALPELQRRGLTATFFVPAGKLGQSNDWDIFLCKSKVSLMSKSDIHELIRKGFEIGSHGLNHISLKTCPKDVVEKELRESRKCLEDQFGVSVDFFSYPFGELPDEYASICRDAGYRGACSIFSTAKSTLKDPYAMRRVLVHTQDTQFSFRLKMTRIYLWTRAYRDPRLLSRNTKNI